MNQYRKGANFERELKRALETAGFFVLRSAGSKGPIDLVATRDLPESGGITFWIQAKRGRRPSRNEMARIEKRLLKLPIPKRDRIVIAQKADRSRVVFYDVKRRAHETISIPSERR